jgi:hypothetical protein
MAAITKRCGTCKIEKPLSEFHKNKRNKDGLSYHCKSCKKQKDNERYHDNKENIKLYNQNYYQSNKEDIIEQSILYYESNKDDILEKRKIYYQENKPIIRIKNNERQRKKLKNDPQFKLMRRVSGAVRFMLKKHGASKNGKSISKYFSPDYFDKLEAHIEKLFEAPENLTPNGEVWMTWDNWKKYNAKTWKDDDYSTHTWELDHIIPMSDLPYIDEKEANFSICHAIENHRPLSAKQNFLDGVNRTRHKIIRKPKRRVVKNDKS